MTAGTIATSDPRASLIGGEVLRQGGNALDAAVTAALALLVVEPHACGLGGDAFVLLKDADRSPWAYDGSGAVPAALAAAGEDADFVPVPRTGPRTFTVPGAMDLFDHVLARHGTVDLARATAPAIALARQGFEVRATLAAALERTAPALAEDEVLRALYFPNGTLLREGDVAHNDCLAEALELVAREGSRVLYTGSLAQEIAARSREKSSYLDARDLETHRTETMKPISGSFFGSEVWELPPPTQGTAVLSALDRLNHDVDSVHTVIDAIVEGMLATGMDLRSPPANSTTGGDTTYVAVIDENGFGVSLITSIFSDFGSTVGVRALGGPLQNRANGLTMVGKRPQPGKPPHTTIPALVTREGELSHVLGVVGGYMQAQGQVQVLVNLLARHMAPQEALDAPRFRVLLGGLLAVEPGHELAELDSEAMGRDPGSGGFGGGQVVARESGRLRGGTDRRRGGLVVDVTPRT
jgi:gamma-glutamyltranspeptidase / glutathione hydrolase